MPTLADILRGIDSVVTPGKRRLADLMRNPLDYTAQAFGQVGDNIAQFGNNAVLAQQGQDLTRMGSVMGEAPQYRGALSSTINGIMGMAPIGMTRLPAEEANKIINDAWWSGKNAGNKRTDYALANTDYIVDKIPLSKVTPNEAGALYDGTVNPARAAEYAKQQIDTPVYLLYGDRAIKNGRSTANVMDGGHRVSAARMRGDEFINAIMKARDYELLMGRQ
jgi:hypothetical protein